MAHLHYKCKNIVKDDDSHIICSFCDAVFHKKCCALQSNVVLKLIGDDDLKWTCSFCKQRLTSDTSHNLKPSPLDSPDIM